MAAIPNVKNLRQYKSRFSVIAEEILPFMLSTDLVGEVKSEFPNLKQIACRYFTS